MTRHDSGRDGRRIGNPHDFWLAVCVLVLGVIFVVWVIPAEIPTPVREPFAVVSPAFFPRLLGIAIIVCATLLAASAWLSRSAGPATVVGIEPDRHGFLKLLLALLVAFGYFLLLRRLGALPTSVLAMLILLPLGGERRPLLILLVSVLLPTAVYLLFVQVARVPLPAGIMPF
jgi:putative tricarboxylic transport membrane protein